MLSLHSSASVHEAFVGASRRNTRRLPRRVLVPLRAGQQKIHASQKQVTCGVPEPARTAEMDRRAMLMGVGAVGLSLAVAPEPALAKPVNLEIKDLTTQLCANPKAAGTPGSSTFKARCFEILGTVVNKSGEQVSNADVYGVVLDAANDPVLRSGRVGAIQDVPPGESTFRLEITVANSQPTPLTLKKFKAQGFMGVVNRSGNPYDMDYESGTFPGGTTTNV